MSNILKRIFWWIRNIILILFALSIFFVIAYKYFPVKYTASMLFNSIERIGEKDSPELKHEWVSLDSISQNMIQAIVASEDNYFFIHNGFHFEAVENNPTSLPTISQQTAQMVFLWPKRSWFRKFFETYFTVLIEFIWGKERIIEVYLNSVETGNQTFGVQAVSVDTFEKPASELTKQEAALIAAVITDPFDSDLHNLSAFVLKRQAKIISLMEKLLPVELGKKDESLEVEN